MRVWAAVLIPRDKGQDGFEGKFALNGSFIVVHSPTFQMNRFWTVHFQPQQLEVFLQRLVIGLGGWKQLRASMVCGGPYSGQKKRCKSKSSDVWWIVSDVQSFLSSSSAFKFSCGMELSPRADTRPDRPIQCFTLHGSVKKHIFQQILSTPTIMVQVCRDINKHHSSHQLVSCEYPTWIICHITAKLPSPNYQIRVWLTWLPPRI